MRRKVSLVVLVGVSVGLTAILTRTDLDIFFVYPQKNPVIAIPDSHLKVHTVAEPLSSPTSMAFVDNNNMLVLEREGKVRLISDGILHEEPVLTVPVNTEGERGLLGIAALIRDQNSDFVFLYYTEGVDGEPLRNRIYRYEWDGHRLFNPFLVLDLPAMPGPYHDGGKLAIGPDNSLYVVIGDLSSVDGPLQNLRTSGNPRNDTSVILRIPLYNTAVNMSFPTNINSKNSQYYLAYGIRNSFGLTFDPLTGNLWDTENGEDDYDEINLVQPGFNSGWYKVMGPISRTNLTEHELVQFNGSKYSDPEFSWYMPIGVTDIEFFNSDKLGDKYENNIFVGDINNGNLYFFELNKNRNGLKLGDSSASLDDLVADNNDEAYEVTFGTGFARISDVETGPDGLLYILSYEGGSVYKIKP